ncbi:hypothetical protein FJY93_04950 [Candidatus Kaiserbacteria bacterium]|nr:hypothetical protein [Candidatus Kaiserbacteria bacterium]
MKLQQYRSIIQALQDGFEKRFPHIDAQEIDFNLKKVLTPREMVAHVKSMFPVIREWLAQDTLPEGDSLRKMHMWIAFTQGYAHACGVFSMNELRRMNADPDKPFVEKQ